MEKWEEYCLKRANSSPVISGSKDGGLMSLALGRTMNHGVMDNHNTSITSANELDTDIDKILEGEIKDSIYSLALRLHRLKWKNMPPSSSTTTRFGFRSESNINTFTEVNIIINMEGRNKIEVRESKKAASNVMMTCTPKSTKSGREFCSNERILEWPKSLRSSMVSCDAMGKKNSNLGTNAKDGRSFGKGNDMGWRM